MPGSLARAVACPVRLLLGKEYPETRREVAVTVALYLVLLVALSYPLAATPQA